MKENKLTVKICINPMTFGVVIGIFKDDVYYKDLLNVPEGMDKTTIISIISELTQNLYNLNLNETEFELIKQQLIDKNIT